MNKLKLIMCAGAAWMGMAGIAAAQTAPAPAPAAAPAASPMPYPSVTAPMMANPNPAVFDAGPLGKITVDGVISGDVFYQSNQQVGTTAGYADLTNGQVIINKTDGPVQFYLQAGAYSIPALGAGYVRTGPLDTNTFGYIPQGFVKVVPNSSFNIMAGALPTLIGGEYTFTFQNMNIERGLLWGQEPAVSKGVQVNYSHGPIALSFAWTDGYYSNTYTALSGLATFTFKNSDTLAFAGEGNVSRNNANANGISQPVTPFAQNNGEIFNLLYSHTMGPWTISPYIQYNSVPTLYGAGHILINHSGDTWGGAILTKYSFTPQISVAGRVEYISSSGGANLLGFGPGSNAWSITLTPTYQKGIFFIRGEFSYVGIGSGAYQSACSTTCFANNQTRVMAETGLVF